MGLKNSIVPNGKSSKLAKRNVDRGNLQSFPSNGYNYNLGSGQKASNMKQPGKNHTIDKLIDNNQHSGKVMINELINDNNYQGNEGTLKNNNDVDNRIMVAKEPEKHFGTLKKSQG